MVVTRSITACYPPPHPSIAAVFVLHQAGKSVFNREFPADHRSAGLGLHGML